MQPLFFHSSSYCFSLPQSEDHLVHCRHRARLTNRLFLFTHQFSPASKTKSSQQSNPRVQTLFTFLIKLLTEQIFLSEFCLQQATPAKKMTPAVRGRVGQATNQKNGPRPGAQPWQQEMLLRLMVCFSQRRVYDEGHEYHRRASSRSFFLSAFNEVVISTNHSITSTCPH